MRAELCKIAAVLLDSHLMLVRGIGADGENRKYFVHSIFKRADNFLVNSLQAGCELDAGLGGDTVILRFFHEHLPIFPNRHAAYLRAIQKQGGWEKSSSKPLSVSA
jgi:hypothetical protein